MTCRTCKSSFAPYELVEHQGEGKEASGLCLKCVHAELKSQQFFHDNQLRYQAKLFSEAMLRKEEQLKRVVEAGDALTIDRGKYNKWIMSCKAWIEVTKEMR